MPERIPHIFVDNNGLPRSPEQAAAEENREEHHAVVPLGAAASHVDFVKKPVNIEEGAGELIENEDGCVVVDKGSLYIIKEQIS